MDVQHVAQFYQQLDKSQLHRLIEIYHPDVVFEDAAHRIEGFDALYQYFLNLYQNVHTCTFTIHEQYAVNEGAFFGLDHAFTSPKISQGRTGGRERRESLALCRGQSDLPSRLFRYGGNAL